MDAAAPSSNPPLALPTSPRYPSSPLTRPASPESSRRRRLHGFLQPPPQDPSGDRSRVCRALTGALANRCIRPTSPSRIRRQPRSRLPHAADLGRPSQPTRVPRRYGVRGFVRLRFMDSIFFNAG